MNPGKRRAFLTALWFGACWSTVAAVAAIDDGTIKGRVLTADGEPANGAVVRIVDRSERATVAEDAAFELTGLLPGDYVLEVSDRRFGSAAASVTIEAGGEVEVEIWLQTASHSEEIFVTAGDLRSQLELSQPTTVLSGEELSLKTRSSLGETLSQEAGVNATSFGAGASRPIIRGLGGDRVRMLQNGIGVGDVSSTSADHAVAIEPATAERIEVLRGPSTLLYGSSAIGGVVNVLDNRIPTSVPTQTVGGFVEVSGGTVAGEQTGVLGLDGGAGRWAWHVEALDRDTGNYDIPGRALVAGLVGEQEPVRDTLPNSDLESQSAALGLSYVGDWGFLGISYGGLDSNYGIPAALEAEEEDSEEEGAAVRLDTEQRRFDLRSRITRDFGPFKGLKASFGLSDYEHAELEGAEVGTRFFNDSWEARVEVVQKQRGDLSGSWGLQVRDKQLEAVGAEAFIPPSSTSDLGVFLFEELEKGDVSLQFGARYENVSNKTDANLPDRSFDTLSGSFGLVWKLARDWSLASSLARSVKAPNSEELYSNGPHFASQAFEVGNPDLNEETSLGFDVALRKKSGRLTGEFGLFKNDFSDYIFQAFSGEIEDGLPVAIASQQDAEFRGAEMDLRLGLYEEGTRHLDLGVTADYVRAELANGEALPRIPPRRLGLALHYGDGRLHGMAEVRLIHDQTRLAPNETPTAGYELVNASIGYRFVVGDQVVDVLLRGHNLTDQEARNHASFLKDRVPMPGRDFSLKLRLAF